MGVEEINALGRVDLTVRRGGYLAIMGPSGSGKTSLIHEILAYHLFHKLHRSRHVAGEHDALDATFAAYQVDQQVMQLAHSDALFMHCLPAHREEEVTTEVLESAQSVVWQEAENRLHAQKALLEFLLTGQV